MREPHQASASSCALWRDGVASFSAPGILVAILPRAAPVEGRGIPLFMRPRQDDWYVAGAMVGSAVRVQRASFLPYGGWWERGLGQGLSAFLGMFN